MKQKMFEGGNCRRCGKIGLVRKKTQHFKKDAAYHYREYLQCDSCKQLYMLNETKFYGEPPEEKQTLF